MTYPDGAQLSPDGNYWWDGQQWQPVPGGAADDSASATDASAGTGSAQEPSSLEPAGVGGAEAPSDAASEQTLAAQVSDADAQSLAQQIAAAFSIGAGTGVEQLNASASDPSQMSGEDVRARCAAKCELSVDVGGEVFALVDCGDGTCPTCPPGLGNLIVRNWCAYVGVTSHRAAIVLHLAFGATLGPFLV